MQIKLDLSVMDMTDLIGLPFVSNEIIMWVYPKWVHSACKNECEIIFYNLHAQFNNSLRGELKNKIMEFIKTNKLHDVKFHDKTVIELVG